MLVLAHLTDIHIHGDLDPVLGRADAIAAAISTHLPSATALAVLVTGDIAYSGTEGQYGLALTLLRRVRDRISLDFSGDIKFVIVPGNHDCDFSGPQEVRSLVLRQLSDNPTSDPHEQYIDACVSVQENFFAFLSEMTGLSLEGLEKLRYSDEMSVSGKVISFDCLNVAWVSQLHESKVTFPSAILPDQKAKEGCVITLLHHPFNWLHPSSYRDFRRKVRASSDFIFTGHEHQWNVLETEEREAGHSIQFEGNVLQEGRSDISGFSVVEIDLDECQYRTNVYQWNVHIYERQDVGSWSKFRRFELAPPPDAWVFSKAFERTLADIGVVLRAGGKSEVALDDVFIFPDLEASSDESEEATSVYGENLIHEAANKSGYVLQGDDRSGRTILLKHLTRKYHESGAVPLLLHGAQLVRATEDEIESILTSAIAEQYGKRLDHYFQLDSSKRVLLVDDFDDVPIKSEKAKGQLLGRLRSRFGVMVLGVSDVFETAYIADQTDTGGYEDLPKYRILPFGKLSRARLISKWVTLDSDEFLGEEERIRRIDESTKYVDWIMRWNIVPRYPIYILTLLQAHKSGTSENFKDSGLGAYYQYLISDAMLGAGVSRDQLTDVEQYCTQFAWQLKALGRTYLSSSELDIFNRKFSDDWVRLDFANVLRQLVASRIFNIVGDVVEFKYSYIYYFFVAKYLAEYFDEPEVQEFVGCATKKLYVRSNANILIFLTHFANKSSVIDAIVATLNAQFEGLPVAQFALRNESVEAMIRQLPGIVYSGGDPEKNREDEARRHDAVGQDVSDGMVESDADLDEISLSAKITTVFKTVEILGQILKTQYARIPRARRELIVKDVLNGPLRALEVFYSSLRDSPEVVVSEFQAKLAEEGGDQTDESRRKVAQRVVASVLLGITWGFLRKASEAVGAEALSDDLRAVVSANDDIGQMLIRLASLLDSQKPLPRVDIEEIRRLSAGSLIVDRLIQVLVAYHLYMFRTSYADIRWAHDVLGIPERVKMRAMLSASSSTSTSAIAPPPAA